MYSSRKFSGKRVGASPSKPTYPHALMEGGEEQLRLGDDGGGRSKTRKTEEARNAGRGRRKTAENEEDRRRPRNREEACEGRTKPQKAGSDWERIEESGEGRN